MTDDASGREELHRLADGVRRVIEQLAGTRAPAEALAAAADAVEAVAAALAQHPRGSIYEAFDPARFAEASLAGSGATTRMRHHAFFDHSPIVGTANPVAPPLELWLEDGRVVARARLGPPYEGPPGAVHGGYIAAMFDEVLGMAQSLGGKPGMTGTLTVRYRRPTPLHADLRFDGELVRVEGRKIFTAGRLYAEEELRAEAEGIFISVDFAALAARMARGDRAG